MEGNWQGGLCGQNKYQYNGKELNQDFGLDWNDYGARFYDAALARWTAVDPLAEKTHSLSVYNFVNNNPINMVDKYGKYAVSVHYEITNRVLLSLGYSTEKADLIAHYASTYADHPEEAIRLADKITRRVTTPTAYRDGIDYSPTEFSQNEENSVWHSMMSDAEAKQGMTEKQALADGLAFGWSNVFDYAKNGGLGKLGQGLHALQDAVAHGGIKTSDHLGYNMSSIGKLHNDEFGNTEKAELLTKSAMIVVSILQGKKVELGSSGATTITFTGMTTQQKAEVLEKLKAQNYGLHQKKD